MTFYYSKSGHCLTDTIPLHFALIADLLGLVAVVLFCFSLVVVYNMKVSFVPKLLSVFWNNMTPTWTNRAAIDSSTYTEWQIAYDRAVVNLQVCCWKPKQRSSAKIFLFLRNFITWYSKVYTILWRVMSLSEVECQITDNTTWWYVGIFNCVLYHWCRRRLRS